MAKPKKIVVNQSKGLIVGWTDKEPHHDHMEVWDEVIKHQNPVLNMMAKSFWRNNGKFLINQASLLWVIDFKIKFEYDNAIQYEERRVVHKGVFNEIAKACQDHIDEAKRYGNEPVEIVYRCLCRGNEPYSDKYYDDYEAA